LVDIGQGFVPTGSFSAIDRVSDSAALKPATRAARGVGDGPQVGEVRVATER
jgi:hypothetical protein